MIMKRACNAINKIGHALTNMKGYIYKLYKGRERERERESQKEKKCIGEDFVTLQ